MANILLFSHVRIFMAASRRKVRGVSITRKKIRDRFFELFDCCQKAHESTDFKEKIKTKRELYEYTRKYRTILGISDEMIKEWEARLIALEISDAEVKRTQAELATARRKARMSEEQYYQALLEEPPTGKKRVNH